MISFGTQMEEGIAAAIAPCIQRANHKCLAKRKTNSAAVTGSMARKEYPEAFQKMDPLRKQFGPAADWKLAAPSRARLQFGPSPSHEGKCAWVVSQQRMLTTINLPNGLNIIFDQRLVATYMVPVALTSCRGASLQWPLSIVPSLPVLQGIIKIPRPRSRLIGR